MFQACEAWKPGVALGYVRTRCDIAALEGPTFVSDLALLASAQMLVSFRGKPACFRNNADARGLWNCTAGVHPQT